MVNQPWLSVFVLRVKRIFAFVALSSVVLLQACGGGGGGGGSSEPDAPTTQNINGGGVKGPLANALVTAYLFDGTMPDFKGGIAGTGTTDASAAITGLSLSIPLDAPYILEFTSDAGTTDITTGAAPVISTLRTVLTQPLLDSGEQVYATPLTTMAVDIAIQNADSMVLPYTGDNNGTTTAAEFVAALDVAAAQVVSTLGFGIAANVDIFDTPPLIDDTTLTAAEQLAVAEYRTAVEALTAMVFHLGQNIATPAVSAEEMLTALTNDLADDGVIDGSTAGPIDTAVTDELIAVEPATLPIPNSDDGTGTPYTPADVATILVDETTTTGSTTDTTGLEDGTIVVPPPALAETNPSQDGDSIPDSIDNCPMTANDDQADANNNGVGNVCEVAPVANNDSGSVSEGGTLAGTSVLANDVDNEGDALTITVIASPANASAFTMNTDGTYSYTHDGGETTTDSFTYQISDGALTSNTATVTITITPVDDPTVLVADTNTISENAIPDTVTGNVLANDSDPDTSLTVENFAALDGTGSFGSLAINEIGVYIYTLDNMNAAVIALGNGATLQEIYTYTANGESSTLTITINGADDGTILSVDTNTIAEDGAVSVSGNVLANDVDLDTALSVTNAAALTGTGMYGSLIIDAAGAYVYSLDNNNATVNALLGGDSLNEVYIYIVNGGPTSSLTITITGADDPTLVTADVASITEDAAPNTVSGNVLSNDVDPDTNLTVSNFGTLNGSGTYGSLSIDDTGAYTYTLDNSNATVDALLNGGSLQEVYDYTTNGLTTSLTITINGADDVAALTADTGSVTEDAAQNSVSGNVLANDNDNDTPLTVSNAAALNGTGIFGSLTIDATGAYTYTVDNTNASVNALNSGDTLSDIYSYSANGQSSTLTITINGADDATVVTADTANITEDVVPNTVSGNVLANDIDADTTLVVTNAAALNGSGVYGSIAIDSTGAYTYTLDNTDGTVDALLDGGSLQEVFDYDTNGLSSTLTITINGNDDATIVMPDTGSVTEDAAQNSVSGNVLTNDIDTDTTLTVTNVGSLNGSGTYGTLSINSTGAYTYTLDNTNSAVNALNAGDTLIEGYSYNTNGLSSTLSITINGSTDGVALNIEGVWRANITVGAVNEIIADGTCDITGDTWTSYFTVAQTGGAFTMTDIEGIVYNGNIDAAGNMTFTGSVNGSFPDTSSPAATAVISDSDVYTGGTAFATDTTISSGSVLDSYSNAIEGLKCETTLNFAANRVYTHIAGEDYNGVFGMEDLTDRQDGFGFFETRRENFPLQFVVTGSTVQFHFIDEEDCTFTETNQTFDPVTGAFALDLEGNCSSVEDNESSRSLNRVSGIFVRNPDESTLPSVSMTLFGEERFYDNVDWTAGTQLNVAGTESFFYGRRLPTVGHTRPIVVQRGNGSDQARIHMGISNPPTISATDTSMLYIEVLDGSTLLCSAPYLGPNNTGRYFEISRLPVPDFDTEQFRGGSYSYANCNTSDPVTGADRVVNGASYTVRILDTGANGVNDGNSADDTIVLSLNVVASISTDRYIAAIPRGELRLNGARVSNTRSGRAIPTYGYFDFNENMSFSWPSHPENTGLNFEHYQLRIVEADDWIQQRIVVPGTQNTMQIPAGTLGNFGEQELQFKARKDDDLTSGIRAHAFSSRIKVLNGIRGLFNFDLDNLIPRDYQTVQISITGQPGFALSNCVVTNNSNMSCAGGSVDAATDTVTLNMTDVTGNLVGVGQPFTLVLSFNPDGSGINSGRAAVTSSVPNIGSNALTTRSAARAVHPELTLRSMRFSNGVEQSLAVLHNPIQVSTHSRTVFNLNDGTNFVVSGGDTGQAERELYNNAGANSFSAERTIFQMLPADDGIVQRTGRLVSQRTNNDWGLGAGLLAADRYRVIMQSSQVGVDNILFRQDYSAVSPSVYVTPVLNEVEILTSGGPVACSAGVACDAANPVDVSADASTYGVRWTVSNAMPTTSRWRLVFRDTTGSTNVQWRTNWIVPGVGMDITVVDNGNGTSIYSWANPGDFVLNPGEARRIQVRVDNGGTQFPTAMGINITSDQAYISNPGG